MKNLEQLTQTITSAIKQNGVGAITGEVLQGVLLAIKDKVKLSVFEGIATPTTTAVTDYSGEHFYLASTAGTYNNFGGTVVRSGDVVMFYKMPNSTTWSSILINSSHVVVDTTPTANSTNAVQSGGVKTYVDGKVADCATSAQVTQLSAKVSNISKLIIDEDVELVGQFKTWTKGYSYSSDGTPIQKSDKWFTNGNGVSLADGLSMSAGDTVRIKLHALIGTSPVLFLSEDNEVVGSYVVSQNSDPDVISSYHTASLVAPTGTHHAIFSVWFNEQNANASMQSIKATIKAENSLSDISDRLKNVEDSLVITSEKLLSGISKLDNGVFVQFSGGSYSINSASTMWESWLLPATNIQKIVATLGKNDSEHRSIIYFSSDELTVGNIVGSEFTQQVGAVNYTITTMPEGCEYVLLSNRKANLATPSATITTYTSLSSEVQLKADKTTVESLENSMNSRILVVESNSRSLFYEAKPVLFGITTYAGVIAKYDELVADNSSMMTKNTLGASSDGTTSIYEYVITTGSYNTRGQRSPRDAQVSKPKILLMAGIHGYEPASVMSLLTFCSSLVNGNGFLLPLRNGVEFRIIPVANPYGFNLNKRGNYNNVDLNRNFSVGWAANGSPSDNPSYYSGSSAASEAETILIQNWISQNSDAALFIDFHNSSYSEVSCFGASSNDYNNKLKIAYLKAIDNLSYYFEKTRLISPQTYTYAYTYGGSGVMGGGTRSYVGSLGIGGGVLETVESLGGVIAGSAAVAVGAECLANMLVEIYSSIK